MTIHECSPHDPCPPCAAERAEMLAERQRQCVDLLHAYPYASETRREAIVGQVRVLALGNDPTPTPFLPFPGRTYAAVVRNFVRRAS